MRYKTISEIFRGADRDAEALVTRSGRWTYGELDRRCDLAAAALAERGVSAGSRVAVSLPNDVGVVVACVGRLVDPPQEDERAGVENALRHVRALLPSELGVDHVVDVASERHGIDGGGRSTPTPTRAGRTPPKRAFPERKCYSPNLRRRITTGRRARGWREQE